MNSWKYHSWKMLNRPLICIRDNKTINNSKCSHCNFIIILKSNSKLFNSVLFSSEFLATFYTFQVNFRISLSIRHKKKLLEFSWLYQIYTLVWEMTTLQYSIFQCINEVYPFICSFKHFFSVIFHCFLCRGLVHTVGFIPRHQVVQ